MYRILIVEDDETIAKTICAHLKTWDYEVQYIQDFKRVEECFFHFQPHMV